MLARVAARDELVMLVLGELAQLGVVAVAQLVGRRDVGLELAVRVEFSRDLGEARVFLRELAEAVLVGDRRGLAEQAADFLVALDQRDELVAQRVLHLSGLRRVLEAHSRVRRVEAAVPERRLDALEQIAARAADVRRRDPGADDHADAVRAQLVDDDLGRGRREHALVGAHDLA